MLCGWEAVACEARSGPRAARFPPSFKSLYLFSSLTPFLYFPPLFSQFLWREKNRRRGLFVLVWCRFSHVLGTLSYRLDSSLVCKKLSWYYLQSCAQLSVQTDPIVTLWAQKMKIHICTWGLSLLILEQQSTRLLCIFLSCTPSSRDLSFSSPSLLFHLMRNNYTNLIGRAVKATISTSFHYT